MLAYIGEDPIVENTSSLKIYKYSINHDKITPRTDSEDFHGCFKISSLDGYDLGVSVFLPPNWAIKVPDKFNPGLGYDPSNFIGFDTDLYPVGRRGEPTDKLKMCALLVRPMILVGEIWKDGEFVRSALADEDYIHFSHLSVLSLFQTEYDSSTDLSNDTFWLTERINGEVLEASTKYEDTGSFHFTIKESEAITVGDRSFMFDSGIYKAFAPYPEWSSVSPGEGYGPVYYNTNKAFPTPENRRGNVGSVSLTKYDLTTISGRIYPEFDDSGKVYAIEAEAQGAVDYGWMNSVIMNPNLRSWGASSAPGSFAGVIECGRIYTYAGWLADNIINVVEVDKNSLRPIVGAGFQFAFAREVT